MKVKIKEEKRYTININGTDYTGCVLESTWEGMACFLVNDNKKLIVDHNKNSISDIFNSIMGIEGDGKECEVVKASPELVQFDET